MKKQSTKCDFQFGKQSHPRNADYSLIKSHEAEIYEKYIEGFLHLQFRLSKSFSPLDYYLDERANEYYSSSEFRGVTAISISSSRKLFLDFAS